MKKKTAAILLVTLLIISALPFTAAGDDEVRLPPLKYTDWQYNDDFTKVTVNGKTYDNYIFVFRDEDRQSLFVKNLGAEYLTDPMAQQEMTVDEYFNEKLKIDLFNQLGAAAAFFPTTEVVYINWRPWQESEFGKAENMNWIDEYYTYHEDINKNVLLEFLKNPDNNGYAYQVFKNNKTLEGAKQIQPINNMKSESQKRYLYKSYAEMEADGCASFYDVTGYEIIVANNCEEMLGKIHQPYPVTGKAPEGGIISPAATGAIKITLHLNDKAISIAKGGQVHFKEFDTAPHCPNGTTLIPVRGVLEALGTDVLWLPETRQVKITGADVEIILTVGSNKALVGGKEVTMLEPAQVVNDRTMIPLRFVSENLGCKVEWFGDEQKIVISK